MVDFDLSFLLDNIELDDATVISKTSCCTDAQHTVLTGKMDGR